MDHHQAEPHAAGDNPGYEVRDVNPGALLAFGGILIVALTLILFSSLGIYRFFVNDGVPKSAYVLPEVAPNLDIYGVLRTLRESEKERLTTYGWVDRKAGIVRIPIDRAMELVVQRGVPKGKGPRSEAELNSHSGIRAEDADSKPRSSEKKDMKQ